MPFVFDPEMMGGMPSASPSLVQALLKKKGVSTPAPTMKGGTRFGSGDSVAPKMPIPGLGGADVDLPDVSQPAPLSFDQGVSSANTLNAAASGPDIAPAHTGMLSRIGDYLKSDEGRAEMMRFAAGAFKGGIGGGLDAATSFADKRRHDASEAAQAAEEFGLRKQGQDNTYNLGLGRLDVDATNAEETGRHNRASEGTDRSRVLSDWQKHVTPSGDAVLNTGERRFEHLTPSGDTQTTQAGENFRHGTQSGDSAATQAGENYRHTTPSGDTVASIQEKTAPRINLHAHYSTTPEEYARNGPRLKPSMVKPSGQAVHISGDADYAALPSGATFIGPDGIQRTKP